MISRGTMRPVKKILGIVLIVAGIGSLFNIEMIQSLIANYVLFLNTLLIVSGYLLFKSGAQG